MSDLAIISYFKDEAHILNEWIFLHLNFGVEYFYLADNNSPDYFLDVLDRYKDKITLMDGSLLFQLEAYKKAYQIAQSKHSWVTLIDLDEFLYIKDSATRDIPGIFIKFKSRN